MGQWEAKVSERRKDGETPEGDLERPAERRGGSGHPSPKRDGAELLSDVLVPWIAAGKEAQPVLGTEQDGDQ